MSRIDTANRPAPITPSTPSFTGATTASTESAPSTLPDANLSELKSSGDVASMIAALLLEAGKASREISRRARDAAAAAEDAAHARKIEHMESAASARFAAGLASGSCQVVGGGAAVTGNLWHNDPLAKSKDCFEGSGVIGKAFGDLNAASHDMEKERAERELTQAKRNVEAAGDMDKDAKDLIRRAMGYYGDYIRAKDDATKAALFRA